MSAIRNNPFRILGLLGNSSEKELQRQIATIKRFSEVGKTKAFDYDFPFWGEVLRNSEIVQEAASKIEQARNKVHYALFWFLNISNIDEIALNNLKQGQIEKSIDIWNHALKNPMVTDKNYSSINNLSTLQLGIYTNKGSFNVEKFKLAIELKGKLLLSNAFDNFISSVCGNGFSIDREIVLEDFADEIFQTVRPYLNKPNGINPSQLINSFITFPNEIKQYISGKFISGPITNIETQIQKTKDSRVANPENAEKYGDQLYKNTGKDLVYLKNLCGNNDVQYQMITNNLANEILQCSIDYYNYHLEIDNNIDPGDNSLKIAKYSLSIATDGPIKKRIVENIKIFQEWVSEKPQRQQQKIVKNEISFITNQLIDFQSKSASISIAVSFVNACKGKLEEIKSKLSPQNQLYLNISTAVASNALGMVIFVLNQAMDKRNKYVEYSNYIADPFNGRITYGLRNYQSDDPFGNIFNRVPYAPAYSLNELVQVVREAWGAIKLIGTLDMHQEQINSYNKNRETLKSIAKQLNMSFGCYIATMAYGSYEHPQVLILRNFRDNTLSKSSFGRGFIRIYYTYSPKLVEHLKDKPIINKTIKSILNTIIRIIK